MTESQPAPKSSFYDRIPNWAVVALILFAVVIGGLAFALRSPSSGDGYGAKKSCQRVVETRLKSPGSADFSNESVTNSGDDWTVIGAVDSENSFGAKVRNTYTCQLSYVNDDWSLVNVDVTQN